MRLAAVVLALVLVGCGDDPVQIEVPTVEGAWSGQFEGLRPDKPPYTVLVQVNFDVAGNGSVVGCAAFGYPGGGWAVFDVAGTVSESAIELVAPWSNWSFAGTYGDDAITGQSSIDGTPSAATTFEREAAPVC